MYGNLRAEMGRLGITNEQIAECLNVHRNSVYNKINDGRFYADEAFKIQSTFFPNLSITYLFEQDASKDRS